MLKADDECSKDDKDPSCKNKSIMSDTIMKHWQGRKDFLKAQMFMAGILIVAAIGNNWPSAYPRNDNHDPRMFWVMNGALAIAAAYTLKHESDASARGVQLLSRAQTEEWKGWMQWAFIFYHYYRVYYVYNEIRCFVSAYVWMTGFGNFLYFDKKQDFSIDRMVSMWLRINYFPLLLSFCLNVKLELYYVVPLHTAGFFITMATCYVAKLLETKAGWKNHWKCNAAAIGLCLLVQIAFYETPAVNFLKFFSDEYLFRFKSDKYTAWVGILSGFLWQYFKKYMQWCYNNENPDHQQIIAMWCQRIGGVGLIAGWYCLFGYIQDKYTYNPMHPYVFWMPVAGWLMLRNSSKYLCELHSEALEFFGRITLETYVLQFHLFMCRDVQYIPVVIPGSGADGPLVLKTLNMLLCGTLFVYMAFWARKFTVTTQTTVTELLSLLIRGPSTSEDEIEVQPLTNGGDHPKLKAKMSDLPSPPPSTSKDEHV